MTLKNVLNAVLAACSSGVVMLASACFFATASDGLSAAPFFFGLVALCFAALTVVFCKPLGLSFAVRVGGSDFEEAEFTNPATGLPVYGGVDSAGYAVGSGPWNSTPPPAA